MKPEKQDLIHDLFDDQSGDRREAALLAGGRILRWRRRRRIAVRSLAVVAILGLAALCLERMKPSQPQVASVAPVPPVQKPASGLTDEELLALFPNTPVALATLENGKKRLIFPRPGDEQRLVTHL